MKRDVIKPDQEQDDEVLLRAFVEAGTETAFRELVRRHLGMVMGVAMRRMGDRGLAEEVAQQVFTALAGKAGRINAKSNLGGWLYRATLLECSEMMRKEQNRKRKLDAFSDHSLIEGEGQSVWREALPVLDEAIEALPTADRSMILLRFFERKSFQQIAATIGKSESAAQKQCERALEKLSALLKRKGVAVPATVLAAGLTAQVTEGVPAGLAVTISQSAMAGAKAFTAKTLILQTLEIMAQAKTKAVAVVLTVALVPLAIQWNQNNELQDELAALKNRLTKVSEVQKDSAQREVARISRREGSRAAVKLAADRERALVAANSPDARTAAENWQRALFEPDPVLRAQRIAALLGSLTPEMAASVAETFEEAKKSGIQFGEEYRLFLRAWGKLDGATAMDYAAKKAEGENTPEMLSTLAGWASASPQQARAWVEALEEGSTKEGLVYGLLDGWAMSDFASAAAYAESRPKSEARNEFRKLLLQRALAVGGVAAAQQWVERIAGDEHNSVYKQKAFDEVIQTMLYRDPSAAAHWIAQNAGQAFSSGSAVADTAAKLAQSAPMETLNWMQNLPGLSDTQRADGAVAAMGQWVEKDPKAAGNWIAQNPQHPAYDRMAGQYAQAIAEEHLESARAWTQTIQDENARLNAELESARAYLKKYGEAGKQSLVAAGYRQETIDQAAENPHGAVFFTDSLNMALVNDVNVRLESSYGVWANSDEKALQGVLRLAR
ncbi:MAG: hypothetical protein K0Q55_3375 [Verrucomicrobia bacterium]|jgi:RNA polymerase sigma factor (sigma-70 family)|nr:hypothetical protein [Verrucomicrobiota bacterium]